MRLKIHVIAQFLKGQKVNLPFKARYIGDDALQLWREGLVILANYIMGSCYIPTWFITLASFPHSAKMW